MKSFFYTLKSLISSYSELFFIRSFWPGLGVFLLTFVNPNAAIAGLLCVASAYLVARFARYKDVFFEYGFYSYNALLVGFSIGHHFKLNLITLLFIAVAGAFTFGLTLVTSQVFHHFFKLPVLSVPFIIISSMVYLASRSYSNLYVSSLMEGPNDHLVVAPLWLIGFLKSLGSIIFLPNIYVGLAIALIIFLRSRIVFCLALFGFLGGTAVQGVFLGSFHMAVMDPNAFNYILIAIGLGGVFLVPSIQSYAIAFVAVAVGEVMTSAVNVFWSLYRIPVFTLPFTVITLSVAYAISLLPYRLKPVVHQETPEETLDHFLANENRFPTGMTANLPFQDTWVVWQGFDGDWTHKGIWKYGYDFVKKKEAKTHAEDGSRLAHYYCFEAPVTAPVSGYVVSVVQHIEDNPIGSVDKFNQFGNLVTIYDARGVYVTVAHLKKESVCVVHGQWVELGQQIGLCGNSGYSPQPHLHMQMTLTIDPLSPTYPFEFSRYITQETYVSHGRPVQNESVSATTYTPYYDQATTFLFDTPYIFKCFNNNKNCGDLHLKVGMALDGTFYLESDKARLYYGKGYGYWAIYSMQGKDPWLELIYKAFSKLPLHYQSELSWTDTQTGLTTYSFKSMIVNMLTSFLPKAVQLKATYRFLTPNSVEGRIGNSFFKKIHQTYVSFDAENQITEVKVDKFSLKKVGYEK